MNIAANPKLVAILPDRLIREFRVHGKHPNRSYYENGVLVPACYDPWWWPIDPADAPSHWGIPTSRNREFQSLCEVPAIGKRFPGFPGSLAAQPGCICILGERPSFNTRYAGAVSKLNAKLGCLASSLESSRLLGGAVTFHVTDLIKFRGMGLADNLTREMIEISSECLDQELQYLQPPVVIVTDMAARGLRKLKPSANQFTALHNHRLKIEVPHWSRRQADDEWGNCVRSALNDHR